MPRRSFLLMLLLFACTAFWCAAEPTREELAQQRVRLQAIRKNPEQYARMRENVNAFLGQSDKKKDAILKLDLDLHELPPAKQARYWKTMERYADWLEQLKKSDPKVYQAIRNAPDSEARLALIKEQRDREWMKTQPKKYREEWVKRKANERAKYVADLRQDERQKHQQWLIAQRFWKEIEGKKELPSRLSDFGAVAKNKDGTLVLNPDKTPKIVNNKVADYVNDYLWRYLSDEEKDQLAKAEGHWPDYPQTLVAIASKHPSALPPPRKEDFPTGPEKLPTPIKNLITDKKGGIKAKKNELTPYLGREIYGEKVVEFGTGKGNKPFDFEFWACNFKSLQTPMSNFVKEQLVPKLTTPDQAELNRAEGQWPYYPLKIQELAKKYNVDPPWHFLPEQNKWHWDRYRPAKYQPSAAEQGKEKGEAD